jgi:hypothetical protein
LNPYHGHLERTAKPQWFSGEERTAVLHYMKTLQLPPLIACQQCGQGRGKLMRHSEDYSLPWNWPEKTGKYELCFGCHIILHCRFRMKRGFVYHQAMLLNGIRLADPLRSWGDVRAYLKGAPWPTEAMLDPKRKWYLWEKEYVEEITAEARDFTLREIPVPPQGTLF